MEDRAFVSEMDEDNNTHMKVMWDLFFLGQKPSGQSDQYCHIQTNWKSRFMW